MDTRKRVALFVGLAIIVGAVSWQPQLTISGDNAEYILISQSIVHGDGIAINGVPQTKYPPGFPIVLAVTPFSYKLPAFISYVLLVGVLAVFGWVGGVLALLEPHLVLFSSQELPDLLFALLVFCGFRARERDWLLGLMLLLAAFWLKSVAIVFIGAYLLIERENLIQGILISVVLIAPVVARELLIGGKSIYLSQFMSINAYYAEAPTIGLVDLGERMVYHFVRYAMWGSVLWLGLISWRRTWPVLVYIPVMLFWPWAAHRLLLPAIPFLIYGIIDLVRKYQRYAMGFVVIVMLCYWIEGAKVFANRWTDKWQYYEDAALWIKNNTDRTSRVCARKAEWLQVVSGRETYCHPFDDTQAILTDWERKGIDYVVVDDLPFSSTDRHMIPAIKEYEPGFEVCYGSKDGRTLVLRRLHGEASE